MRLQSSLGRSTGGPFYGSLDPYLIAQGLGLFHRIPELSFSKRRYCQGLALAAL